MREAPSFQERQRRAARNEARCRDVNERIEEHQRDYEIDGAFRDFICECVDMSCTEVLSMTIGEYETVRAHANRFVVAPQDGHVAPDVETVIAKADRYWTVAKGGAEMESTDRPTPAR
jgi:hypothetical protein